MREDQECSLDRVRLDRFTSILVFSQLSFERPTATATELAGQQRQLVEEPFMKRDEQSVPSMKSNGSLELSMGARASPSTALFYYAK